MTLLLAVFRFTGFVLTQQCNIIILLLKASQPALRPPVLSYKKHAPRSVTLDLRYGGRIHCEELSVNAHHLSNGISDAIFIFFVAIIVSEMYIIMSVYVILFERITKRR